MDIIDQINDLQTPNIRSPLGVITLPRDPNRTITSVDWSRMGSEATLVSAIDVNPVTRIAGMDVNELIHIVNQIRPLSGMVDPIMRIATSMERFNQMEARIRTLEAELNALRNR